MFKKSIDFKSMFRQHWLVVFVLCIYFAIIAYKLVMLPTPFFDWDESIYAQSGREMIEKRSFFVPLWQDQAWLDKPPLPSLTYGIAIALSPENAEVASRIVNLILAIIVLFFVYALYYKITTDKWTAIITIIVTAFVPSFLQRSQVLNVDVFLLLGWLGYVYFERSFRIGLLFLLIGTLSKSLLGYYPVVMFLCYEFFLLLRKKIKRDDFICRIKMRVAQISITLSWFVGMIAFYGTNFIHSHFYESHFKRVAASIESHFGARTFYIDLIIAEMGVFILLASVGVLLTLYEWWRSKQMDKVFFGFFFLPWFIFLNLTKTKIAWYIYPVVSQFSYLAAYPLSFFKNQKYIKIGFTLGIFFIIYNINFKHGNFIKTNYSSEDDAYHLAMYARGKCKTIDYLVNTDTRNANATLKSMNLTIASTEWWGDHPRVVYYFGGPVHFHYEEDFFTASLESADCVALSGSEEKILSDEERFRKLIEVGDLVLYKR